MKRMYAIGNGFDMHHGVRSSYREFEKYVRSRDAGLCDMLERYFDADYLWSDLERALADIDMDRIIDDASRFLSSYGADDWSDSSHHDYQYELSQSLDLITVELKRYLVEWAVQLDVNKQAIVKLDKGAAFLTFNYTDTLERVYSIPKEQVLYVHGKAETKESILTLGHDYMIDANSSYSNGNDQDTDVRVAEGNEMADAYYSDTYKDTAAIIKENEEYFSGIVSKVDEVFVLGHSLSNIDIEYFRTIHSNLPEDAMWYVSFFNPKEEILHRERLIAIGVDSQMIAAIRIADLC